MTPDDVLDVSEMPALLDRIDAEVPSTTADGACDGESAYNAVAERHPQSLIVNPPLKRVGSQFDFLWNLIVEILIERPTKRSILCT